MKMECPWHSEALQYKAPGAAFRCSGCHELGFGVSYCCERCSYILHEECTNPVSHAIHPFFPKSYFEFYVTAPGHRTRYCDACGKDVGGFVYHCSQTRFDLHPCCLKLKGTISDEEGRVTLELCEKVPSKCAKCKHRNVVDGVKGWSYVSRDKKSCYHVLCFKELIAENWKRGYFSQQTNSIEMSGERDYSQIAVRNMEMVRTGGRSRTIRKYTKIAVVIFKLIFSAIFGNPISAITALVEALVTD
ncbi:hypothetical protein VNO77_21603 [Canavalia gladiata]|uniref:DC1 domain-containing protein n=1 Tax=Canavalia gladiata TaxID=3824 RepID=A0AAN9LSC7_CANGL